MFTVDTAAADGVKVRFLEGLYNALEVPSNSGTYMKLFVNRERTREGLLELFAELGYPGIAHYSFTRCILDVPGVSPEDWTDKADGGESLAHARECIRAHRDNMAAAFEEYLQEHVETLNAVPREYLLAAVGQD